ncbi:MAG TPA: BatA domain-containing protein, partial [Planctomycetota bacterium]|nr:BatA domain-containing protein [Planctomycetota bacterium]
MKFEQPAALWGLASLLLLILFSLWRQAAARVTVPSLLLWKKIPERNPPVRALRRPRWRLELLFQALTIAAVVAALAGPYRETEQFAPRRIALVFDTSPRMQAGDRIARMKAFAKNIQDTFGSADQVTSYWWAATPKHFPGSGAVSGLDVHVDLKPMLLAASASAEHVILFSDRPVDGPKLALFGAPADNAGIVELSVSDDEVFIRIVNHGPARPLPIDLVAGDLRVNEIVPAGQRVWSHKADYSKASSVRVTLETKDSFPLDDVVEATKMGPADALVTLAGRHHEALVRVFRSIPGVTVQHGRAPARVAVGFDEEPGPGDWQVWIHSPGVPLTGVPTVA